MLLLSLIMEPPKRLGSEPEAKISLLPLTPSLREYLYRAVVVQPEVAAAPVVAQ
jgi:hypothetical protein